MDLTQIYSQFQLNLPVMPDYYQQVRPPNVIGAGAKKCGTSAFANFMRVNPQFRTGKHIEAHYLYKVCNDYD